MSLLNFTPSLTLVFHTLHSDSVHFSSMWRTYVAILFGAFFYMSHFGLQWERFVPLWVLTIKDMTCYLVAKIHLSQTCAWCFFCVCVRIKIMKVHESSWCTHRYNAVNGGWIWLSWQGGEFSEVLLSADLVEWKKQKPKYGLNACGDLETSSSHWYTKSGHVFQSQVRK